MTGLSAVELRWVDDHATVVFKLTAKQSALLRTALRSDTFSLAEVGDAIGVSREYVRQALASLEKQGLLQVTKVRRKFSAEAGRSLRSMLESDIGEMSHE